MYFTYQGIDCSWFVHPDCFSSLEHIHNCLSFELLYCITDSTEYSRTAHCITLVTKKKDEDTAHYKFSVIVLLFNTGTEIFNIFNMMNKNLVGS